MNSLANLNAVVDVQGDSSTWSSDQGWDPPVATICTGSLSDNRLHFHHSTAPRQEWDWLDSHVLLASQYGEDEHENIDCKPSILQVEALGSASAGGSGCGLRQYSTGIISTAGLSPSVGGGTAAAQSSWPGLLNAVPLRQHGMGQPETSTGSCYSSSSLMYGGGGGAAGLGGGASATGLGGYYTHHSPLLGLANDMDHQRRIHDILKRGMYSASTDGGSPDLFSGRLGLNLGGRTYFSPSDSNLLTRFHVTGKRFRPNSPSMHVPLCQAEGCRADLSIAKHYHRRHKVCEYHSKASTVIISGNTQRFCQQCSRFHALTEFDEGKRSCRKRLADHNRRRRKPQPGQPAAPPNSGTASTQLQPTSSTDNAASNQNEDQETKAGSVRTDQPGHGVQLVTKEETAGSTSSDEPATAKPSLLSPMTLAPSIALSLQNGSGSRETQSNPASSMSTQVSSELNYIKEKDVSAYENQSAPFLLNGPSLSLSNNNIGAAAPGAHVGGDSVATSNHPSPAHTPHSFNEVELSVPWLRQAAHVGSSSRINLMQKSLGKLSTAGVRHQEEGSMLYNTTNSCSRHENEMFINRHGHFFAEHMHNLQAQPGSVAACSDPPPHHHHHHLQQESKTEDWSMLETAVAQDREGQIVLSLLETAGSRKEQEYNDHQSSAFDAHQQAGAHERHALGFNLQHQHAAGGLHLSSGSPSDHNNVDHEASDAALSLHCMQALRPLNESLYTTADFMKDGFV